MDPSCDVLVVGAGPAGCAAALTARRRGLDVVVADKATFPRDKTCGDGLTANALRLLESLGLTLDALPSYQHVDDVVVVSPSGRHIAMRLPSGGEYAAVVPRLELDNALVDLVVAEGIEVRQGAAVASVVEDDGSVVVGLDDGRTIRARRLIAADGHYSTVRKLLGSTRPSLGEWSAFRQYFSGVTDRRLWVLLEAGLLPGYAWVFPLPGNRANVGFAVLRTQGVTGKVVARRWRELLDGQAMHEILGEHAVAEAPHRAWPIAGKIEQLAHGRVLFAGDAAGVVDPMTGEGIAQAIETGMLAADAIAGGGEVAGRYTHTVEQRLGRDLRFARVLRPGLGTTFRARATLRVIDGSDWTRSNFARWMFEDYPRALLLTPSRWHRGMLHGAGAYRSGAVSPSPARRGS
jgi:geranylgeranyl reductase family protein